MNRTITYVMLGAAVAVILSMTALGSDHDATRQHGHEHGAQHKQEYGASPLLEEMIALDEVFRNVVSGVAVGDGQRVHAALEQMHGTMERTHEGVHHGTVTLKKNAVRMKEFVEQDKQFHGKLEDLAKAAHRNDGNAMLALTKDLLDRCVKCHGDFRLP